MNTPKLMLIIALFAPIMLNAQHTTEHTPLLQEDQDGETGGTRGASGSGGLAASVATTVYSTDTYTLADFQKVLDEANKGNPNSQCMAGKILFKGKGDVQKNAPQAVVWFDKSARQGNQQAQFFLGSCLLNGKGIAQPDPEGAIPWLENAANKHPQAYMLLGTLFFQGTGIEKNPTKAFEYFMQAAQQETNKQIKPEACNNVGHCFEHGYGTAQDYKQAIEWYEKAISLDFVPAKHNLGMLYAHVSQVLDYKKAFEYTMQAAKKGVEKSQYYVATCFEEGKGTEKKIDLALYWYLEAAKKEYKDAQEKAAQILFAKGEELHGQKNYIRALEWLTQAADRGHTQAAFMAGELYASTDKGITQSYELAIKFYEIAGQKNNPDALNKLGLCYLLRTDAAPDDMRAFQCFEQAAQRGLAVAQYNLGNCYRYGKGTEPNLQEAMHRYQQAADQGNEDARQALTEIGKCSCCVLL